MKRYRVILDTNVILAAMRSQTGASHRLLLTIGHPGWQSVVTPALMYEYEDVVRRPGSVPGLSRQDITDILDLISASRTGSWCGSHGVRCRRTQAMI